MSARLKDGWQVCPKCGGRKGGCWDCQKTGVRILCPICANASNQLFSIKAEKIIKCELCAATFGYDGKVLSISE